MPKQTSPTMKIFPLIALLALAPGALLAAEAIKNFDTAVYTETVKDVNTVFGLTGKVQKAKSGESFTDRDLVKSGRGSRAQITLTDGTLIRIGPNAVFSLDRTSRSLHLIEGSVLFYAPPGMGGGRIVTESVTCAVTGTTILVNKDKQTGVKMQVLEGRASFTRANGKSVSIGAGESAESPPGDSGEITTGTFSAGTMTGAILVSGFSSPLPSAGKIVAALGSLPAASPAELAAGTDTGSGTSRADALASSGATFGNGAPIGGTVPNLGISSARDPLDPGKPFTPPPLSPNGEGQNL